jgi:hypothetical protein
LGWCISSCGSVRIPLLLLGNGSVKFPLSLVCNSSVKNPPIVARQRLGRDVTAVTNTHVTIEEMLGASFQCGPCRIKESRLLGLPRTSCIVSVAAIYFRNPPPPPQPRSSAFATQIQRLLDHVCTHFIGTGLSVRPSMIRR